MNNTNKEPLFTVIIPTYNRQNLLPRAIRSVFAQTCQDFELIITDDGSEDQTEDIVKEFINKYKNIKYLFHEHVGVGASKNMAIKIATGKYVTFLGDDDEYLPQHLEFRRRVIEQDKNIEFIYGGIKVVGNEYVPDKNNPKTQIHISKVVAGGTFFIKKEVFSKIGYFPEKNFANDTDYFGKVVAGKINKIKVDFPTYIYYRLEDSITNNHKK